VECRDIFGSGIERETYFALRKKWAQEVDVFPLLPVRVVVGFDRVQAIQDKKEKCFLLKTEFDYVVCWKNRGIPMLVVEFDGIGCGFSRGVRYETIDSPRTVPNRRKKLEAKLRICAEAEIPAVVASTDEVRAIDAATHFTILDGIIGEVLASSIFTNAVEHQRFKSVDEVENLEIELSLQKNPINREISRLLATLLSVDPAAGRRAQKRLYDRQSEDFIGCNTTVRFGGQEFAANIYIRDVNCQGFAAYGLAESLSELAALKDAARSKGMILLDELPFA